MIFKSTKWNLICISALFIIAGILMIIFPTASLKTIAFVLAGTLAAAGLAFAVSYCLRKMDISFFRYDLVFGLALILLAVFIFLKVNEVVAFVPVFLGFLITLSGILKLQNALNLLRVNARSWLAVLIFALLGIGLGILLIVNPFKREVTQMLLSGVGLTFSGITDLLTTLFISRCIRLREKKAAEDYSAEESISVAVNPEGKKEKYTELPN